MGEVSVLINQYNFDNQVSDELSSNFFAKGFWPLVYIISDGKTKVAYIGETADAFKRMQAHLKNDKKSKLSSVLLITCDKFNKSATLDIESSLIKYMSADKVFKLLNSNGGLSDHNYYQKNEIYQDVFRTVWDKLRTLGVTKHSIEFLNNSDLFKYSPYKSLTSEQNEGLIQILEGILDKGNKQIIAQGGAGTGKTILAIFLFKLLSDCLDDFNFKEFGEEESRINILVKEIRKMFPDLKMALVVPMASFRKTLQKVFRNISGLNAKMVIGPAEVSKNKYDIILVDESHRLRQRVNLGAYYGSFDKACKALGLNKMTSHELEWITLQSKKALFFYDEDQSIKPSDVKKEEFDKIKALTSTKVFDLQSQFRVKGGNAYVSFIDKLLYKTEDISSQYTSNEYELKLFHSIEEFRDEILKREGEVGLSRMMAGYSWKWISKNNPEAFDINIDSLQLRWNSTASDWINSENSKHEVGCIHTTQGYDLNYAGIIFGNEISYDPINGELIIDESNYFDRNGKQSIKDPEQLKQYILNIYKTMMLRGIKGTYVYVCDPELRGYFEKYIPLFKGDNIPQKELETIDLVPFVNSVPLYDLNASAGLFSSEQIIDENHVWIALPDHISVTEDLFACKVIGESMNRIIPNGSICLFRRYSGGSRNGKIVLVESSLIQDEENGSSYTVKEYQSTKQMNLYGWKHHTITLKPKSTERDYKNIVLKDEDINSLRVLGIFENVIE
jgi:DUF2075 family protein/predicted GIY-YIG superfamily endonuclease